MVFVCHPGASRMTLLKDTASAFTERVCSILSRVVAQSAEKGSWPEVICATEEGLKSEALYDPTKRAEMVGPIGECPLDEVATNREMAAELWTTSENKTEFICSLSSLRCVPISSTP